MHDIRATFKQFTKFAVNEFFFIEFTCLLRWSLTFILVKIY